MLKRTDIKSILLIGSGPIVIGQACEFDCHGPDAPARPFSAACRPLIGFMLQVS